MASYLEGIGRSEKDFRDPKTPYEKYMVTLSKKIANEFKEYLNKNSRGSGALSDSIIPFPSKEGFTIEGDFYYKFIDKGVSGVGGQGVSGVVTGAPFKFKHLGVGSLKKKDSMVSNIRSIIPGAPSNVYAAAVSIKQKGIKAKDITDNVLTDKVLKQISEDLLTITGISLTFIFEENLEDHTK